jgi:hypothetical protein
MWNAFLERRKRVDMMSTALVMTVEVEQTKIRPSGTSGEVVIGEMSFAQSFGERTGLAGNIRTMNGAVDASSETLGGKSSELVKNSDALPLALTGARPNADVVQRMAEANEAKSASGEVANGTGKTAVVDTNLVALANAADRGQSKTTSVQLLADRGEVQKNIGANVVAQTGVSQTKAPDAAAATENEKQSVGNEGIESPAAVTNDELAEESTTVTFPGDEVEPIVQNETLPAAKVLDVAPAKKDAKAQEGSAGAKTASKPGGTIGNAKPVGDASIMPGVQGAISLPVQMAEPSYAQPSAVGVTAANVSGVVVATAGKLAVGTSTTGSDSTGRKALARAGKDDEVEAAGQGVKPAADATVATGFGPEIDRTAVVTSASEKDGDGKELSAIGAVVWVHGVTGNEAVVPGTVTGMPFTHTSAERTKVQAGEAGPHAATPYAGLVEQDGPAVPDEMGMSHRTLLATPMALEVGVANGTQGWLKIRAEMTDSGVVNASLSSATSSGQEMLHRELPALTAYLQDERVAVNTVVIPASAAAGTESRFAGEMDGDGSRQSQQSSNRRGGDERQGPIHGIADEIPPGMGWEGAGHEGLLSAGTYAGGGSWLNVRA